MKHTRAYKLADSSKLNITDNQKAALLKIKSLVKKLNSHDSLDGEINYDLYLLVLNELVEQAGYDIAYAGPRNAIPNDVEDCEIIIDPYRSDDKCFLQKAKN